MPLTVMTFVGAPRLLMLREFLASLYRAWPRLPHLRVVHDGSISDEIGARALAWWPGPKELTSWSDASPNDGRRETRHLLRFARREVMARKLAAVVASAARGPTLYSDVDVLWFRSLDRLGEVSPEGAARLVISQDFQPSYDPTLVEGALSHLARPPFFCAGFLYASGDLLRACDLGALLEYAAESGTGPTEQTILAEAAHQLGGRHWSLDEVVCKEDDRFTLAPSFLAKGWAARHYIGQVRHIFWRDALALRLGLRATAA